METETEIVRVLIEHLLQPDRAKDIKSTRYKLEQLGFYKLDNEQRQRIMKEAHELAKLIRKK